MRLERRLPEGWTLGRVGDGARYPAQVPGSVHLDLMRAGVIPDPHYGTHELDVQWVGECDWVYAAVFTLEEDELTCGVLDFCSPGLDTFCTVRLNGQVVGRTQSMFIPVRMDLRGAARAGANELELTFESAARWARTLERAGGVRPTWNGPAERLHVRKAQYHWSWDWGPTLITAGLPWGAWLEIGSARLPDLTVRAEVRPGAGGRAAEGTVTVGSGGVPVRATLLDPAGVTVAAAHSPDPVLTVREPRLWWPSGHGEQPLYTLTVERPGAAGDPIDAQEYRLGLRTLELVREPLADGETFAFRVNGRTLFVTGANWIPDDTQLARVTPRRLRERLQAARDAHFTMLRVWGGGVYESDAFYDLCDELGLLVWQDFMFACGLYPGDEAFRALVRQEAQAQVRRLSSHACLALWCGNNEDHQVAEAQGYALDGSDGRFSAWPIYHRDLPDVVARLAPHLPYWPGSPWTPPDQPGDASGTQAGDRHAWEIWHGPVADWQRYGDYAGRFVSEFGVGSGPHPHTVKTFAPPAERRVHSRILDHHDKATGGVRRMAGYLAENLPWPADLPAWLYATQVVQAEAMAGAVRQWRRRFRSEAEPFTAGALVWQLNDCWPATSWALIDASGWPKPALHALARACAPLAAGLERTGFHPGGGQTHRPLGEDQVTAHVSALVPPPAGTRLEFTVWTSAGEKVDTQQVNVALHHIGAADVLTCAVRHEHIVRVRWLDARGAALSSASSWPQPFKHARHPAPELLRTHGGWRCERPLKSLWAYEELPVGQNYVDLFPDETWPADLAEGVALRSLGGVARL